MAFILFNFEKSMVQNLRFFERIYLYGNIKKEVSFDLVSTRNQ